MIFYAVRKLLEGATSRNDHRVTNASISQNKRYNYAKACFTMNYNKSWDSILPTELHTQRKEHKKPN